MEIAVVDAAQPGVRQMLIDYLRPHETRALFLVGNLQANFQPSFIYTARNNNALAGICGYYPTFQSCTIYSEDAEASRLLARKIFDQHMIGALLGMKEMARPAYDELIKLGKAATNSPEQLFLELALENFQPHLPKVGIIRPVESRDVDAAVLLSRQIHQQSKESPITEEERMRIMANSDKFCLEIDGKIVSIAFSNGLAIEAFQLLGVSTDPAYQRRGFAKAVCSHLIARMQKKGAKTAVIFTGPENQAAIQCYMDLGFRITDRYYMALFEPV